MPALRGIFAAPLSPTLKLTSGVWAVCLFSQILRVLAWRGEMPLWTLSFFPLIVLSGIALSMVLLACLQASRGRFGRWRWSLIGFATVAIALAQSLIDHAIYRALVVRYGEQVPPYFDFDGVTLNLNNYLWLYGLYTVAVELLEAVRRAGEGARQAAEARALAQQAQVQALRFQLNPHFLFNTLNAISGLVVGGRNAEAEAMLLKLGEFLRASLGKEESGLTDLIAELGMVEAYLDIEAVRFGPSLRVRIDCPEQLYFAQVPVFILQPLVENAVKYAIAPSEAGGTVTIRVRASDERLSIAVIDRGIPSGQVDEGLGVGLANTRSRLAAQYGDRAALQIEADTAGFTARIELPLQFEPDARDR